MNMREQNPEMARQFMAKLETLDKAGELDENTSRQLAKDLGLDSRFTKNDDDAKEFFDMLIKKSAITIIIPVLFTLLIKSSDIVIKSISLFKNSKEKIIPIIQTKNVNGLYIESITQSSHILYVFDDCFFK